MFLYTERRIWIPALVLSASMLSACSSSSSDGASQQNTDPDPSNDGDPSTALTTVQLDATAGGFGSTPEDPANKWTYYNFETASVVELTDAQADESNDWHIAFKRVGIKVNGGSSGPGDITAALIDAQTRYYDENGEPDVAVFSAATADTELASLERDVDMNALSFTADADVTAISADGASVDSSWWLYNTTTHTISANPNAWVIVRGADGVSYAKLHVTDIQQSERQITVEMYIQGDAASSFSTDRVVWTALIGSEGGSLCYDFDQLLEVNCADQSSVWDLQFDVSSDGRAWNMWTNSGTVKGDGTAGAAFGPLTNLTQADFASAASVPTWFTDDTGGVFQNDSWYAYNLQGNNQIWPNYRVYGIKTDVAIYKMQITGYYNQAGVSGNVTIRFGVIDQSN